MKIYRGYWVRIDNAWWCVRGNDKNCYLAPQTKNVKLLSHTRDVNREEKLIEDGLYGLKDNQNKQESLQIYKLNIYTAQHMMKLISLNTFGLYLALASLVLSVVNSKRAVRSTTRKRYTTGDRVSHPKSRARNSAITNDEDQDLCKCNCEDAGCFAYPSGGGCQNGCNTLTGVNGSCPECEGNQALLQACATGCSANLVQDCLHNLPTTTQRPPTTTTTYSSTRNGARSLSLSKQQKLKNRGQLKGRAGVAHKSKRKRNQSRTGDLPTTTQRPPTTTTTTSSSGCSSCDCSGCEVQQQSGTTYVRCDPNKFCVDCTDEEWYICSGFCGTILVN